MRIGFRSLSGTSVAEKSGRRQVFGFTSSLCIINCLFLGVVPRVTVSFL